jgi:hypothetical protein
MDELSGSVCMVPYAERAQVELLYFIRKALRSGELHEPGELIWTRPGSILGDVPPELDGLSSDATEHMQMQWVDHIWQFSLEALLSVSGFDVALPGLDLSDLAQRLNSGKMAHAHEIRSYEQAYRAELDGALDAHRDLLRDAFIHLIYVATGLSPSSSDQERLDEAARSLAGIIKEAFRQQRVGKDLPFLHIPASIHAAVRRDHDRKYKDNDWHDFNHASAALPYCDVFLTDRSLHALISQLGLDRHYGVQVAHEPGDAVSILASQS